MGASHVIERGNFDELFDALAHRGYTIIGPTIRDRAIVYDEIRSADDLPVGLTAERDAGHYRLVPRGDQALFGYAVGPHSWKKFQLPLEVKLWEARVDARGDLTEVSQPDEDPRTYAFFGARSCELHASAVVERNVDLSDDQLTLRCEQAIRNHDPCISCSTHFLDLTIDRA